MAVKYELMVPNGKYLKDGETKTTWLRVGRVLAKKNGGFAMKMDCVPTAVLDKNGNQCPWDGWLQMFEPKPRQSNQQTSDTGDFDDDIPF